MDDITLLKKEIFFRGTRRGLKEIDLIFGRFLAVELDRLTVAELRELRDLLTVPDNDLLAWFVEGHLPADRQTPLTARIRAAAGTAV